MNKKSKTGLRAPLFCVYVGMILSLLACAPVRAGTGTPAPEAPPLAPLRLAEGAVEVQGPDQAWVPVGGDSTFELVGVLESTDPWMVTGNTFATRETTQIADGLEPGDRVRVRGVILADATWLASSIERAEEAPDPTIFFTGKVNTINPWVVNGISLNVTEDTLISGEIQPDMYVRVEVLLAEDGTWEVLSISPVEDFSEVPGCISARATVESVSGNEVKFAGWPAIVLGEDTRVETGDGAAATLSPGQSVLVVVCATDDGQFMITRIVILPTDEDDSEGNAGKVLVCHKPEKKGGHTLSIAEPAVPAHLAHGDTLGACP